MGSVRLSPTLSVYIAKQYLLAFAMVSSIFSQDKGREYMALAGPGFRDFTRIAGSDPKMWRDILLANRAELLAQSHLFKAALSSLETMIANDNGDALEELLTLASQVRSRWQMTSFTPPK